MLVRNMIKKADWQTELAYSTLQTGQARIVLFSLITTFLLLCPTILPANEPAGLKVEPYTPSSGIKAAPQAPPTTRIMRPVIRFRGPITIKSTTVQAGNSLRVSATVGNLGAKRSGPYKINFYIAKDTEGYNSSRLLKSLKGPLLNAKAFNKIETNLLIPANQRLGAWNIVARIDQAQKIQDTRVKLININRNQGTGAIRIGANKENTALTADNRFRARPRESLLDTQGRIGSITPHNVEIGEGITITGSDFGDRQGRVSITFGAERVTCHIDSWRDDRISMRIPELANPLATENPTKARVWVYADGKEHGPSTQVNVIPDEDYLTPVIERLSTKEIRPGRTISIDGSNFLPQSSRSRVEFRFLNPDTGRAQIIHPGIIVSWSDSRVRAQVPEDISGLGFNTPVMVEIENRAGNDTLSSSVYFQPELETIAILDRVRLFHSPGPGNCRRRDSRHRSYRAFEGRRLINGWKVVDWRPYVTYCTCCDDHPEGCVWGPRPSRGAEHEFNAYAIGYCEAGLTAGSTRAGTQNLEAGVEVSFKPNSVRVQVQAIIQGPRGVPYE